MRRPSGILALLNAVAKLEVLLLHAPKHDMKILSLSLPYQNSEK